MLAVSLGLALKNRRIKSNFCKIYHTSLFVILKKSSIYVDHLKVMFSFVLLITIVLLRSVLFC